MKRILVQGAKAKVGHQVKIVGFVQTVRDLGNLVFIILRDISGTVQVVCSSDLAEFGEAKSLSVESVVEVIGEVTEEKKAPDGVEVQALNLRVLSLSDRQLPIPVGNSGGNEPSEDLKLRWRWLDLRHPKNLLIFKVWSSLEQAFREYLLKNNFIQIHSPKLMAAPSESGAELFQVKYFDRQAYLAQSPQFYKQMAMASGFERVFEIGPVFRANPSFTSRHDTEFTSYDVEISYIESHNDLIDLEERVIQYVLERVKEEFDQEIRDQFGREIKVPSRPFPKISMTEAKEFLIKQGFRISREGDLNHEEEQVLCNYFFEKEGHEFLFVTDYPQTVRPFYHMRSEKNSNLTKSFDLLWNGLEITTGAQREHRYDTLISQAREKRINLESIEFYLEFFKYGCPPHGGFAIGPTRMLMKIFNLKNVRKVTFLYRGPNRLEP